MEVVEARRSSGGIAVGVLGNKLRSRAIQTLAGRAGGDYSGSSRLPLYSFFVNRVPPLETKVMSRFYRGNNGNDLWSAREGGRIPENDGSEGTRWRQAHSQKSTLPQTP